MLPLLSTLPHANAHFRVAGPVGDLEVQWIWPPTASPDGISAFAVICHPHPLHGGTMQNKVVTTLTRVYKQLGIPCACFNFRGVGQSAGDYAEGEGEQGDLAAVVSGIRQHCPQATVHLAGFSFGAYVAAMQAETLGAASLLTVAPPVGRFPMERVVTTPRPWYIAVPLADEVVNPVAMMSFVKRLVPAATVMTYPETSHFFHGKLVDLQRDLIAAWQAQDPAK